MTDLERARAHLQQAQGWLARERIMVVRSGGTGQFLPMYESCLLAALSWVWECQEDEK